MAVILNCNFERSFELSHPLCHQMDILDHEPVTFRSTVLEGIESDLLLTLSHGDVSESLIILSLSVFGTDSLDVVRGVNTREEDEESWLMDSHLVVANLHIERWLINEFDTKTFCDVLSEGTLETIGS